jgi:cytochrome b6-f complex iron-sulfur subunit
VRRRDWIIYLLATSIGTFFGLILFLIGSYLKPPKKHLEGPVRVQGWVPVVDTRDIPPEGSTKFAYGDIPGIIINDKSEIRAFSLRCSHFGCVVNWIPERKMFSCPCHGGEFNSEGVVIGGPPRDPLNEFAIQIREQRVYVKLAWLT